MTDPHALRTEVTAVVVTCGTTPFVRTTLAGLANQTHRPTRVIVVDIWTTGRDLGTGEDLARVVGEVDFGRTMVRVVKAPEATTFGDAVRRGLALNAAAQARADWRHETRTGEVPVVLPETTPGWIWLLHDDSAPAPDALEQLLRVGEFGRSIGIAGAKQRDWSRPAHILEVGIQATRSARRFNPIDDDEIDQGQHDHREDVLGVGLAGAIVRRDVWEKLGGPDPALGPFGDGLEFSRRARLAGYRVVVVPGAVIFHVRATYLGLRTFGHTPLEPGPPDADRSFGARRRAQLYNWLVAAPGWQLPLIAAWLIVLTPARALARFIGKEIPLARRELSAGGAVLSRPDLWMAARRRTASTQVTSTAVLSELEVAGAEIRRKKREQRRAATEIRKLAEAPSELELRERATLAARRRTWGTLTVLLAAAISAIGLARFLGVGTLSGGSLLPSDARLADLAEIISAGWIPVGNGVPGPVDPLLYFALIPLVTGVSLGTVVSGLLLLAVPLAAVGAWFAAGTLTRSIGLRAWATALWALAPTLLVSVLQGRIGPTLTHVLLPFFVVALIRAIGRARRDVIVSGMIGAQRVAHRPGNVEIPDSTGGEDDAAIARPVPVAELVAFRPASLGAGAAAALLLAALAAATPVLLPVGLILSLALLPTRARATTWFLPLPSLALFAPLLVEIAQTGDWEVLFASTGVPFGYEPASALATMLGMPSSLTTASLPEWMLTVALVPTGTAIVVAVVALARSQRAWGVRAAWLVVVTGLGIAFAAQFVAVAIDDAGFPVRAWPGAGLSLALLGFLAAGVLGADGIPHVLSRHSFGWRHISAGLLAGVAGISVVFAGAGWAVVARSDVPELRVLEAAPVAPTPALAGQLATSAERARTLALTASEGGAIVANLWRDDGPQLHLTAAIEGARSIADPLAFTAAEADDQARAELSELAAALAAGVSENAGQQLADFAIGVVLVPPGDTASARARQDLVAQLDATAGLARVTENESGTIWRVASDGREGAADSIHRVTLRDSEGALLGEIPSGVITARGSVPATEQGGRVLVVAERAHPYWSLVVNGAHAVPADYGWRQAFFIPAGASDIRLSYDPPQRVWLLAAQILVFGSLTLLALPVRKRRVDQ